MLGIENNYPFLGSQPDDPANWPSAGSEAGSACCEKLQEIKRKYDLAKLFLVLAIIAFLIAAGALVYIYKHPNFLK